MPVYALRPKQFLVKKYQSRQTEVIVTLGYVITSIMHFSLRNVGRGQPAYMRSAHELSNVNTHAQTVS